MDQVGFKQVEKEQCGGANFGEIRMNECSGAFGGLFLEDFTIADDMIEGSARFVLDAAQVRFCGHDLGWIEVIIDQGQNLFSGVENLLQIVVKTGPTRGWGFVLQHFAVAEDMVDRGAKVVACLSQIKAAGACGKSSGVWGG